MRTIFISLSLLVVTVNCDYKMTNTHSQNTNRLIHESSPYLRQHANNPVDWYPWGDEALQKSKEENLPILLSIGYSSCHWCHVMAHESFENDTIAQFMNEHFINIKLDREERPDIDQIYMEAVQNMGLNGGWPLNVFLTSDLKPFYGGTYFPPQQWQSLLTSVSQAYTENYEKLYASAERFAESLQQSQIKQFGLDQNGSAANLVAFDEAYKKLKSAFDPVWGGMKKAPKFPMPSIWEFLAHYYVLSGDSSAKEHFLFTLDKIAAGGIYDQIGGGFSRYAVDGEWHVPHFEKMLYDNGQLMSIYAIGYKLTKKASYKQVMTQTAEWLAREMMNDSGGFYSALDADSEGEEGKFYTWTYEEIKALAAEDFSLIAEYYDVSREGNWEGKNVLRRLEPDEKLINELNISLDALQAKITTFNQGALQKRSERIRPGLDDKIISGWNGLMLSGLLDAYQATGDSLFLNLAIKNAVFIKTDLIKSNGLLRVANGKTRGFLEDYAAVIKSFITYYETTFDEEYLKLADRLTSEAIENFYDEEEGFFFYTSGASEYLIARKKEIFDNVIPSSNSIMANNLYRLGLMLDKSSYLKVADSMVSKVNHLIPQDPQYLSNWALTSMMMSRPTSEVLLVGDEAQVLAQKLQHLYLPNKIIMATKTESNLPLFSYKEAIESKTTIYVCYNKTCRLPVFDLKPALKEIKDAAYLLQ